MTSRALAELLALLAPPRCAACRAPLPEADRMLCARVRARAAVAARRGLPALRSAAPPARGLPGGGRGVRRRVGAAGLRGRGARPRAGAEVPRRAAAADVMAAQMAAGLPAGAARRRRRRAGAGPPRPPPVSAGSTRRGCWRGGGPAARAAAGRRACGEAEGGGRSARRGRSGAILRGSRCACAATPPARVLLVDDVHTTGATLDACARALVDGGSRWVAAVSYARTL